MPDVRHVDAYLMSSPGLQAHPQVSVPRKPLHYEVMRHGFPGIFGCYAHLLAVGLVPPYRSVHGPIFFYPAADHRFVLPGEAVLLYLLGQTDVRQVVLRDHQQTACVLVDTMDYPRAYLAVDA